MRVDLPAPFSPQIAWTSPRRTVIVTSERAFTPGNVLVIPVISRIVPPLLTPPPRRGCGAALPAAPPSLDNVVRASFSQHADPSQLPAPQESRDRDEDVRSAPFARHHA